MHMENADDFLSSACYISFISVIEQVIQAFYSLSNIRHTHCSYKKYKRNNKQKQTNKVIPELLSFT